MRRIPLVSILSLAVSLARQRNLIVAGRNAQVLLPTDSGLLTGSTDSLVRLLQYSDRKVLLDPTSERAPATRQINDRPATLSGLTVGLLAGLWRVLGRVRGAVVAVLVATALNRYTAELGGSSLKPEHFAAPLAALALLPDWRRTRRSSGSDGVGSVPVRPPSREWLRPTRRS